MARVGFYHLHHDVRCSLQGSLGQLSKLSHVFILSSKSLDLDWRFLREFEQEIHLCLSLPTRPTQARTDISRPPHRRHHNHLWTFPKPDFQSRVSSRLPLPVVGTLTAAPRPSSTRLTDFSGAALAAAVTEAPVCSPRVELDDEPCT
jgi:hypothetical protein